MIGEPNNDTVAAVATAPGEGAIAIVRMSGPDSLAIADRVFQGSVRPTRCPAGRFLYGTVRSPEGGAPALDEVLLLVFRAPHSYTREDTVEIQCHGGRVSARRLLRAVLAAGARPAEPGEFTRRAFLNGRLDLLQAEAVAELIRAQSERAAAVAFEQLQGRASADIGAAHAALLSIAADLEASLDFDEDTVAEDVADDAGDRLRAAARSLANLLHAAQEGRLLREGARVPILGRPNAGKSTLLNRLLGHDRAIVAATPGTTRDTIEETAIVEGFPIRLTDTAGLRETDCPVEQEGVGRARALLDQADLVLYVLDARAPHRDDRQTLAELPADRTVVVANKTDLGRALTLADTAPHAPVFVSLLRDDGADAVRQALLARLQALAGVELHALASERHRDLLRQALDETEQAVRLAEAGRPDQHVLVARHAREAMALLGRITGGTGSDDVLDEVFRRFCVGK